MKRQITDTVHHGQIVAFYRNRLGWSQERLAYELGTSLSTVQRMEQLPMIKSESRRKFLVGLLGIPASLLNLESNAPVVEQPEVSLNADSMTYRENTLSLYWGMYRVGGPLHVASSFDIWLQEITDFEKSVRGTAWHSRAMIVLAMSYQLQGCIARYKMDYRLSHKAYQQAFSVAQELDDAELLASARAREGTTFFYEGNPLESIAYYKDALNFIEGISFPHLRGNVLLDLSKAYASAKQKDGCWRSVDLAQSTLDIREHRRERTEFLPFGTASITAQKGVNALFLGDYERACAMIDKSLRNYNPSWLPRRARLLARKAEAYYGMGAISDCIETAQTAWELSHSVGSHVTISQIQRLHVKLTLSRWKNEPGVAHLGALLAL